jgi:hypothetical protein
MASALLQFGGSLLAVIMLAVFVSRLGLGRAVPLLSEAEARSQAAGAIFGFEPKEVALDKSGRAALLSDDAGRLVLLAANGVHFIARQLSCSSSAEHLDGVLAVSVGELGFGTISLTLGSDAAAWGRRIDALKG